MVTLSTHYLPCSCDLSFHSHHVAHPSDNLIRFTDGLWRSSWVASGRRRKPSPAWWSSRSSLPSYELPQLDALSPGERLASVEVRPTAEYAGALTLLDSPAAINPTLRSLGGEAGSDLMWRCWWAEFRFRLEFWHMFLRGRERAV